MIEMDSRDSVKCRKSKLGDIDDIIEFVLNEEKDKIGNSVVFPKLKETKTGRRGGGGGGGLDSRCRFLIFLEREPLLSRLSGNRTVGILRSKKESCSTRRGLRVGSKT